jgi:hypothetical protein
MPHPKDKRDALLKGIFKSKKRVSFFDMSADHSCYYRNMTKRCSDPWCCGNPRKRGELTLQEKRFKDRDIHDVL